MIIIIYDHYIYYKMSFNKFIYEEGIIGITLGTIAAFAIGNFVKDIKLELITPLILSNKYLKKIYLLSSLIELFIMFFIIFLLYHIVLKPVFNKEMSEEKESIKREKIWKEDMLYEVKNLHMGSVYL